MTIVAERREQDRETGPSASERGGRAGRSFFRRHRGSAYVLAPLLILVGVANGWNLQGWPGRVNDDEGTYVAEAWAVIVPHHLSHYTYWYDHPPLGWMLMAAYIWLTRGFQRYSSAVMAGREFMWVINLVACVLLYQLARRLRLSRPFAVAAVVIYGLSPLSIFCHRMVFLDNIATTWMLAALVLAASPRRSLAAAAGSGICFAFACLSKETIIITLPAVVWVLWQHADQRTRRWSLGVFGTIFVLIGCGYPLYAALRGELLPGPGHVSLAHALWWQLVGRQSSGSLLDTRSSTFGLVKSWVELDPVSLLGAAVLAPAGLLVRRLRPVSAGFLVQALLLLRGGYVPYMYVTAMLPFGAVAVAGLANSCWQPVAVSLARHRGRDRGRGRARLRWAISQARNLPVLAAALVFVIGVCPAWAASLARQSQVDGDEGSLAATAWINTHLRRGQLVVVDDYVWPDVTMHGKATPLWCWKVNGDPWVRAHLLTAGYRSIDYVVLPVHSSCELNEQQLPTLAEAISHSRIVRTFANGFVVRKVTTGAPGS